MKLKNLNTVVRRSYPVRLGLRTAVERELDEMLQDNIMERSVSAYCNPLWIVKKSLRICLDARHINQVIKTDNESLPLTQKIHGETLMSMSDLANGYYQTPLKKSS